MEREDLEEWRQVPGFSGYEVSSAGVVRSIDRVVYIKSKPRNIKGKVLSPSKSGRYGFVNLCNGKKVKKFYVHRAVMLAFCGASKKQVNHKNGNRYDNSLKNLEYLTSEENHQHALRLGLFKRKLTKEDVDTIRFFYSEQYGKHSTTKILAKVFDISLWSLRRIVIGKIYKHL